MAESAKPFIDRSPRYTLRATDQKKLKFAVEGDSTHIYSTTLVNISMTGLAFVTQRSSCPKINDLIKLEFQIPGGTQVAWWGKVVRIESYREQQWNVHNNESFIPTEKLVAVSFENIPQQMRTEISKGLTYKIKERNKDLKWNSYFLFLQDIYFTIKGIYQEHGKKLFYFLVLTVLTLGILFYLAQPSGKYTPDRGAPWGQRFK